VKTRERASQPIQRNASKDLRVWKENKEWRGRVVQFVMGEENRFSKKLAGKEGPKRKGLCRGSKGTIRQSKGGKHWQLDRKKGTQTKGKGERWGRPD